MLSDINNKPDVYEKDFAGETGKYFLNPVFEQIFQASGNIFPQVLLNGVHLCLHIKVHFGGSTTLNNIHFTTTRVTGSVLRKRATLRTPR